MREGGGVVQSLDRALRLLEALADAEDGCRLVDLASRAGLPVSTTHRLLTTLQHRRFVQFDRDSGTWTVGAHCFAVGANFLRRRGLVSQATPYMDALNRDIDRTVNLGIADKGEVVFLARVESPAGRTFTARPGGRSPMHCSGLGKALLSAMDADAVLAVVNRHGLRKATANSIADPDHLYKALHRVRKLGYAVDDQENTPGLRCVASVIYNEHGHALAAVSAAGPVADMGDSHIAHLGPMIARTARSITQAIGGRQPVACW